MQKHFIIIILFSLLSVFSRSQGFENIWNSGISLSGKVQTDILAPQTDEAINTGTYNSKILSNTYGDINLSSKYMDAGLRFEMYEKPLPGFEAEYEGAGIPFFYFTGKYKNLQLTVGNFYEQFGSGLIFRAYEERSLGLDNSLRGCLLTYRGKSITIKALGGYQRHYWKYTKSSVYGVDAELNIDEWINRLKNENAHLQWGTSFVSKYQQTENIMASLSEKLNLPEKVGAFASRLRFQKGKVNLMTEYAIKANDPSADNNYIYKNGSAFLLSGSYSQKGLGLILQAKRSDNMGFRSERTERGSMLFINHLPAFTKQHTYALAALYPYATQSDGEWAFQGVLTYKFSKGTSFGGKYGADIEVNYARVNSIKRDYLNGATNSVKGTDGYRSDFFAIGNELYYQDFDIEISKKINNNFSIIAMYMNQVYNQEVIEGHANNGSIVHSNMVVMEGKYKLSSKAFLRMELQYLHTMQDYGDWMFGLLELSVLPSWMFTVSDMYNNGATNTHYYMLATTYSHNAHRLQLSYGRTRAGFNCSGGVCRYVPASKGLQVSYIMSF
jgi:hypothetical protein